MFGIQMLKYYLGLEKVIWLRMGMRGCSLTIQSLVIPLHALCSLSARGSQVLKDYLGLEKVIWLCRGVDVS